MYYETLPKTAARNISNELRSTFADVAHEQCAFVENTCKLLIESRFGPAYSWVSLDSFARIPEGKNDELIENAGSGGMSRFSFEILRAISGDGVSRFLELIEIAANRIAKISGTHFRIEASAINGVIRPPPRRRRKLVVYPPPSSCLP